MSSKFLDEFGLAAIRDWVKSKVNTRLSFDSSGRKATFTNTNTNNQAVDIQNINSDKSSIYILANGLQTTNYLPTEAAMQAADANLQTQIDALGEPFRIKQWANSFNVEIPTCTEDISNTAIAKMVFSITGEEGENYQIVGIIAYEVFDAASGGNRINCWPVCQFTGNGQKELSVRWMCAGTTRKTAKRINAWVLLKHR